MHPFKPKPLVADSTQPSSPNGDKNAEVLVTSKRPKPLPRAFEKLAIGAFSKPPRHQPPVAAKTNPEPDPEPSHLANLPEEILNDIGQYLPADDLVMFAASNKEIKRSVAHNFPLLKNDLDLLKQQAESLQNVLREERWPAFEALVEMQSKIPNVQLLQRLVSLISYLPLDSRTRAVKAVLDKVNVTRHSHKLPQETPNSPNTVQVDDSLAELGKLGYADVLDKLAMRIFFLPEQERATICHGVLEKSGDVNALYNLVGYIADLPEQEKTKGFYALLDKCSDNAVLNELAREISEIPAQDRVAASRAIDEKKHHLLRNAQGSAA